MADYSDLKLKLLDELCDKLDDCGIDGNVIERDSRGRPYVNIWYGSYEDRELQASQMFTVVVTGDSLYWNPHGCYEITPPGKYLDYFKDTFSDCRKSSGYYVWIMTGDKIIRTIKFLFNREKMERKKENNMNNFTLETKLFGKLRNHCIYYKFKNGVYNPEEVIITMKSNNPCCKPLEIALVRSVPYSEDSVRAYEVRWMNVPSFILARHGINREQGYDWSDDLIHDIALVENDLKTLKNPNIISTDVYRYSKADVLATEALYKYREYCIVDVIFNDPATIIIWADGTKTVVKAENEKFDPEKGLAMAISKKVLGNKYDYYEVFKKYVGRYEKKQAKKAKKEN